MSKKQMNETVATANAIALQTGDAVKSILEATAVQFESPFAARWMIDGMGNAAHRLVEKLQEDFDTAQAQWLKLTEQRELDNGSEVSELRVEGLAERMNRISADQLVAQETVEQVRAFMRDVFDVKDWAPYTQKTQRAQSKFDQLRKRVVS